MEYVKLISKINFFDLLLGWMNGHCGCIELVEYIPFDYLYVAFAIGIRKLHFFRVFRWAHAVGPAIQ
jgi:hypothetical protein